MTIEVTIIPIGKGGYYRVMLGDREICRASRQPLLSAARVFLKEGVDPAEQIAMRRQGSDHVALTGTIGVAAGLTVIEKDDGMGTGRPYFARFRAVHVGDV